MRDEFWVEMSVAGRRDITMMARRTPSSAIGTAIGVAFASMELSETAGSNLGRCAAALDRSARSGAPYPIRHTYKAVEMTLRVRSIPDE